MAGRQPAGAVRAVLGPLGVALECVTRVNPRVTSYARGEPQHRLLHGGRSVTLRGSGLRPAVAMGYRVVNAEGEHGARGG